MYAGFGRKKFRAAAVAAGSYGSFVLSETGQVVSFGVNASGQLGHEVQVRSSVSLHVRMQLSSNGCA